jgi:hydrogenase nickel incorporation protein HypA/HybF
MHEIAIANSIIEAVQAEAKHHPGKVPCKVAVRIGEMAAVDPDALRFCFETLTRETELQSLQLEVELCPLRHLCPDCNCEFPVIEFDSRCPQCGGQRTRCVSGDQLDLAYLEVEEYEPSSA